MAPGKQRGSGPVAQPGVRGQLETSPWGDSHITLKLTGYYRKMLGSAEALTPSGGIANGGTRPSDSVMSIGFSISSKRLKRRQAKRSHNFS